jgi:hypothetical protein
MKRPFGKQSHRRLRRRWEGNIRLIVRKMSSANGRGMELTQDHIQCLALILVILTLSSYQRVSSYVFVYWRLTS